jgi:hypothetical protein
VRWRVVLGFLALTLVMTWPLGRDAASSVLGRVPDTDLFMWTLAWGTHALTNDIWKIFDANIYYPQRLTLAYSENLIGDVIVAAPVLWTTGNSVLALNVVALTSCLLCAVGAYVLARRLGASRPAAVLCGIVFAFAPPRFLRIGQLHLTVVQWIPFSLAFLHAYLDQGRPRDLRLAVACFTLQVLSSGHGAVFAAMSLGGLLVYRFALGEPLRPLQRLRDFGMTGALLLMPAILTFGPYLAVQREMALRRTLEDWAVPASTFLASPTHVHRFFLSLASASSVNEGALAWLFPGYLPVILAAAALVRRGDLAEPPVRVGRATAWTRLGSALELAALALCVLGVAAMAGGPLRWRVGDTVVLSVRQPLRVWALFAALVVARWGIVGRAPFDPAARLAGWRDHIRRLAPRIRMDARMFYLLLTVASFLLSIGPPLGIWPLVYWLPGLNLIRVPSRFTIVGVLGLAVLSSFGFDRLMARRKAATILGWGWIACAAMISEFALFPLPTVPYRVEIPAIDRWLDSRAKPFAVAEVPLPAFGAGGAWERRQAEFMLHSTAHWQRTVHGYSGIRPPLHESLYWQLRLFPDDESISALQRLGVTYIVVHTDMYAEGEWPTIETRLGQFRDVLQLEHEEGAGRVYALRPSADAVARRSAAAPDPGLEPRVPSPAPRVSASSSR